MATGVTLSKLLEDLAHEVGETTNPNSRTQTKPVFIRKLQRHQDQLYEQYDWPHLHVWRDVSLSAGQTLYDFPSDLNLEQIEGAWTRYGRQWFPLIRDLSPPHYGQFDSDDDERFAPAMRWHLRGGEGDFEVWPVPSDNDQVVRFVGKKALGPLVDDSDTCDLDSNLIVLFAAAEILARRKATDANIVATQAQNHLARLRANLDSKEGFSLNGEQHPVQRQPFGPPPVDYS
jgi:hypothetical protein